MCFLKWRSSSKYNAPTNDDAKYDAATYDGSVWNAAIYANDAATNDATSNDATANDAAPIVSSCRRGSTTKSTANDATEANISSIQVRHFISHSTLKATCQTNT